MIRRLLGAGLSLAAALGPAPVRGQMSSDEGAPFLMLPVGAGAVSLGRAVTAMPGQESAFWNPAGLASLDGSRLVVIRADMAAGTSTAASALLARPGVGTLGVSYLLMDSGGQEATNADGFVVGDFFLRHHMAVVSGAARLLPGLDVGVNFKVLQFRGSCRGACAGYESQATSYAIDAGLQWAPRSDLPLRLGAMVAHLGPRFQHENASQADPLPTRVRVAAAWDVLRGLGRADMQGWLTVELQERPGGPGGPSVFFGSEVSAGAAEALFLRAGYATDGDQPGGASVGLGLRTRRFELSVAKSLAVSLLGESDPFSVSFAIH